MQPLGRREASATGSRCLQHLSPSLIITPLDLAATPRPSASLPLSSRASLPSYLLPSQHTPSSIRLSRPCRCAMGSSLGVQQKGSSSSRATSDRPAQQMCTSARWCHHSASWAYLLRIIQGLSSSSACSLEVFPPLVPSWRTVGAQQAREHPHHPLTTDTQDEGHEGHAP